MENAKLSVVVCTHNPRDDYLSRTIDGLRQQTLELAKWELVLVDNRCDLSLDSALAEWHPFSKTIREDILGLTHARICGINHTTAPLIVFVDDDNVLHPDYLQHSIGLASRHPMIGVFGAAKILPVFETAPTPACRPYVGMLALRQLDRSIWSNDPRDLITPWGAGLVVRREVAVQFASDVSADRKKLALDRAGESLDSCGDNEFSWTACNLGYGKGLFVELALKHLIDSSRVTPDYLQRIAEGHSYSDAMLRFIHEPELENFADRFSAWSPPTIWRLATRTLRQLLGPFGRLLQFSMRHRIEDSQRRGKNRARKAILDVRD